MIVARSRVLTALIVSSLAVAVGTSLAMAPLTFPFLFAMAAILLVLATQAIALPLVVLASGFDRLAPSIAGVSVRVDSLVVVLLLVILVNRVAVRAQSIRALASPLLIPLACYLGVNIVSTLLFASERVRGLKLDLEIAAAVATFVVVRTYLQRPADVERALRLLWIVSVAEAAVGLFSLLLYVVHLSQLGVQQGDFGLPMVYGTQYEANIFGSFLVCNFFVLLASYVAGNRSGLHLVGLCLILAGIAASMTRTVWLALILGLLLFVPLLARGRGRTANLVPIIATVLVLALGGAVIGAASPLAGRLVDIVNLHSSSASGRFVIFNAALADWKGRIFLGTGTGSFNFGAAPGQAHPWLPNLTLLTLHDTGLVGLAILVWLVAVFFQTVVPAARRPTRMGAVAAGAGASLFALLFAFQATSGFWFAYPWIVAALGISAARLSSEEA